MAIAVRLNRPLEDEEQIALFTMVHLKETRYPVLQLVHMVPNGAGLNGFTKTLKDGKRVRVSHEGALLKKMGLRKGVSDVCCPVPSEEHHGLYIEMKRIRFTPSEVTREELDWLALVRAQGYRGEICGGWIAAWNTLCDHLALKGEEIE